MSSQLLLVWMSLAGGAPLDSLGCTPLQAAVLAGSERSVWALAGPRLLGWLPTEAKLNERGREGTRCGGRTPLMLAAEDGQLASTQVLLNSGADFEAETLAPELGEEPLTARCLALIYSHDEVVAALDRAGARANACPDNARLFRALVLGAPEPIALALRAQPSPKTLLAALTFVVPRANPRAVELLVEAAKEGTYAEVYRAALVAGETLIVEALSSRGARLSGGVELALAIDLDRREAITWLVLAGASTAAPEVRAAVLAAVRRKQDATLIRLLSAGYRGDPQTPLLLHAVRHFPSFVPELVNAGVEIELDDEAGTTPLMAAAAAGRNELVTLLISRGASVETGDVLCETAFDVGARASALKLHQRPLRPLPGRAAQRLGITCGAARLSVTFADGQELFLPQAVDPMRSAMEHRIEPGVVQLRVRDSRSGRERTVELTVSAGLDTRDFASSSLEP